MIDTAEGIILRLEAENSRLRGRVSDYVALDVVLRQISKARDGESTANAMKRSARERTEEWQAEVRRRDELIAELEAQLDDLTRGRPAWEKGPAVRVRILLDAQVRDMTRIHELEIAAASHCRSCCYLQAPCSDHDGHGQERSRFAKED